tara:strand:+ start:65 stop:469 length:405 start_codon:yes stop_codon:yes gene_type:complete
MELSAKDSAKSIQRKIRSGINPPLKQSTIDVRKRRGISGTVPLFATGKLYKSIKNVGDSLEMEHYGKYHHHGFTPKFIPTPGTGSKIKFIKNNKGIKVPARPFIFPSELSFKELEKQFIKDVRRALATTYGPGH